MKSFWLVQSMFMLLFGSSLWAQQEDSTVIEVPAVDSVPVRRALTIPEFVRFNTDTIALDDNDLLISDSYTAMGQPYVYDALHSFNRRRMDHFGGYLNDKINAGLALVRQQGFPSDLKKLYIQIDPQTLTVYWSAVVGPSEDGRCYLNVDSRGSAGGGIPAVQKQCPRMHRLHSNMVPIKLLEFSDNVIQCFDWYGNKLDSAYRCVNIRQHFYKYYDPRIGNSISLEEWVRAETPTDSSSVNTTNTALVIPKKAPVSTKRYKVRSGDTLSQIAQKHRCSIAALKRANGLRSDMIREGQILKIPN